MKGKLFFLISTILTLSSVKSVEIVCTWSGETCSLGTGALISQPNEVITIFGKPTTYINTVTTQLIFNEFWMVRYIPANIFPIFTSLKTLQMTNCGLTNLAANFTTSCPSLERITIDESTLQAVPEGFLQTCSNILYVSFRHNQITTIDRNAFRGLSKLYQLDMTNNKITCLHPDLFQHTPVIVAAHFTYNKISAIDKNLFRPLKSIGLFDIRSNSLTYLPALNLSSTATTYMAFYASGNPIYAINPNFCSIYSIRPLNFFDNFNIANIPCLPKDQVFYRIEKQNCQASATILQSCYANWSPALSDNVVCGQGSGVCISSNVLSKMAEFIKFLPV